RSAAGLHLGDRLPRPQRRVELVHQPSVHADHPQRATGGPDWTLREPDASGQHLELRGSGHAILPSIARRPSQAVLLRRPFTPSFHASPFHDGPLHASISTSAMRGPATPRITGLSSTVRYPLSAPAANSSATVAR